MDASIYSYTVGLEKFIFLLNDSALMTTFFPTPFLKNLTKLEYSCLWAQNFAD